MVEQPPVKNGQIADGRMAKPRRCFTNMTVVETVHVLFNNLGNDPMTGQSVNIPQCLPACTGFVELKFRSSIVMCLFVCKTHTVYIHIHTSKLW